MTRASKFLEQVHTNFRKLLLLTYQNHIYYILFINNQLNMTNIYIIKFKSKVFKIFKIFQIEIER